MHDKIKQFKAYSLAFDEGTDISDTYQLIVFLRGVSESFELSEEKLDEKMLAKKLENI